MQKGPARTRERSRMRMPWRGRGVVVGGSGSRGQSLEASDVGGVFEMVEVVLLCRLWRGVLCFWMGMCGRCGG